MESNRPRPITVFTCYNTEELKRSISRRSLDPRYKCSSCGKKYCSLSALKTHKIRHKSKEDLPFQCLFCPYKCAAKRDHLRHQNQHIGHAQKTFKCEKCDKTFKIISSLNEHRKSVHTNEVKYQCGICNFMTSRRSTFRTHLGNHDKPEVQIVCPICLATFLTKSNLKIHLMTHADARPFKCKKCAKKFTVQSRLTAHEQTVHSTQAFQCKHCDKKFSTVHNLNRHTFIHTGERPFNCCFCEFNSNTRGNLVKHVRKVHKMIHFTYKDILRKRGELTDPKEGLSERQIMNLADQGKKVSELHLKILKERGLTTASLEQLQQKQKLKNQAKEMLKLQIEAKQNAKASSKKHKASDVNKKNKPQKRIEQAGNKKHTAMDSFYLSNCDFILPRADDGTYVINTTDGAATPAIHVVWNVSSLNTAKQDARVSKEQPKERNRSFSYNSTEKKCKNVNSTRKKKNICDINLSHSSQHLNSPSNILEDHYAICEKSSTPNQLIINDTGATDFESGANVLVTSLESTDRVDSTVDFKEIGPPPSTNVHSVDDISDIDRMYENIDSYNSHVNPLNKNVNSNAPSNHLIKNVDCHTPSNHPNLLDKNVDSYIPINQLNKNVDSHSPTNHPNLFIKNVDSQTPSNNLNQFNKNVDSYTNKHYQLISVPDNSHFSNTFEPGCAQEDRKQSCGKLNLRRSVQSLNLTDDDNNLNLSERYLNSERVTTLKTLSKNVLLTHNPVNDTSADGSVLVYESGEMSDSYVYHNHEVLRDKNKQFFTEQNSSSHSYESSSSPFLESPDQVIVLKVVNEKITKEITNGGTNNSDRCNHEIREITIKNSLHSDNVNDFFNVMSVAQVDGLDKEVVLVVDALS